MRAVVRFRDYNERNDGRGTVGDKRKEKRKKKECAYRQASIIESATERDPTVAASQQCFRWVFDNFKPSVCFDISRIRVNNHDLYIIYYNCALLLSVIIIICLGACLYLFFSIP